MRRPHSFVYGVEIRCRLYCLNNTTICTNEGSVDVSSVSKSLTPDGKVDVEQHKNERMYIPIALRFCIKM
jgi:hypothetical protein